MALFLRENDVKNLLSMEEAIHSIEKSWHSVSRADATNYPRQRSTMNGITLNILPSVSMELDMAGIKSYPIIRSDVTVGSSFTMLLYKISTGMLEAILEADSLGQIRTGAASGVATKYMARPDSRVLTLFGAGYQARTQLEGIYHVLPQLERVNVISRSRERKEQFCHEMMSQIEIEITGNLEPEKAVTQADIITTATGAVDPVFDGRWLRPGVHINATGSNFANKRELDTAAIRRADRIAVDDKAVARQECGDLIAAQTELRLDWNSIIPMSDIVGGQAEGRATSDEVTLFESHGLGLQDLAAAYSVLKAARERGVGIELPVN